MSLDRSISHAIEENNIETMRSLLAGTRYPGSIINQTLDSPNTPPTHKSKYTTLTYAIRLGRSEMLKVLLQSQNDTQWFRQQIKQSLLNSTLEYAVFLHANSYDKSEKARIVF